jgi:quinol monooxygenase YgiN
MAYLEVIARAKVRPGQLEGFKAQAAEIVRVTREKDTHTLRCDWFINEDGTECEVHEAYLSGQGLIEHNTHVMDARAILFGKYEYGHRMTVFGEVSQELRELSDKHAGGSRCVLVPPGPANRGGCLGDEETGVTSWAAPACWNG